MQPMPNQVQEEEEDGVIDLNSYTPEPEAVDPEAEKIEEQEDGVIDMQEYAGSDDEKEATWGELAKDLFIQPALGTAAAFTWPLDVLKVWMVGESLTDLDELESAFEKAGKPFDREKYLQNVAEMSTFIPTQQLAEDLIQESGFDLEPKSETGKKIRKFFTLVGLLKGKGITKQGLKKAAKGAAVGTGTTEGLKAAGVNETVADLVGDVAAGGTTALTKEPRVLAPEIEALQKTAAKHNLPFPEYLTREGKDLVAPKISQSRKTALQKEIGMTSKEAIDDIIAGKLNVKQMKQKGVDLEVLTDAAYDEVTARALANPKKVSSKNIVADIDAEIARIKSAAPSPSDADKAAISILENERNALTKAPPKPGPQILGPNGQPINPPQTGRVPIESSNTELVEQIRKYNSNVSQIYKRPEFTGREDAVRSAYAFLNNSIRNTIESESGPELRQAMKVADSLYAEKAKLERVENLVTQAFKDGDYNPKKLSTLLNSKKGLIVRRELGDAAVDEIRDIAKYGESAYKATNQLAKSSKHLGDIAEWGPFAGFLLYKIPKAAGVLIGAKAVGDRVRGYLMTRPATRTAYRNIVKNAANGSFKTVGADFAKIEAEVSKEFGSVDEFLKAMNSDLELVEE